ncbi:iron-sulfur cluster biosynthesis transcriptional regulator SufR [Synechococcus sp. PCC 7502]|uniref:iron-sulfur cluster biosynthesis transcriptional regulator SufR n=1 Tax=Synechococcus sp. PCC 7502 TaxID=1173263 RepID=UPI00029FEF0D|nr:iron-sulfur cluster biosynthesis transcriptional regulator SufR [Synechococcus sp. PCC 7502]AFY74834.1 iron-sulfur cluster biosynthesis transcriptional regulator SufR [Synechococcus sp. PCC 7502]
MKTTEQNSTKEDILRYLLKQGQATAQELAECFTISPQAVRRHLKDLESENLIQHQVEPIIIGRPQHIYQLSIEGRKWLRHSYNEQSESHDKFAVTLLDNLIETLGVEQVTQVLHKQWQRKAVNLYENMGNGTLEERIANLAKIRRAEGYVAEWHKEGDGYIFTEYNCAISEVAESFPSVCSHELEMFGEALPDCDVVRTHWLADGQHRCGYLIKTKTGKKLATQNVK